MKNNLLEINFLQNIIEKCNQRISELRNEIRVLSRTMAAIAERSKK